jgi:hypothetical protein
MSVTNKGGKNKDGTPKRNPYKTVAIRVIADLLDEIKALEAAYINKKAK